MKSFSKETKRVEKQKSRGACRICGIPANISNSMEYLHIDPTGDDFADNCLYLCLSHALKIMTIEGREKCTSEYLSSLKRDQYHCTALVQDKGIYRRCKNSSGRATGVGRDGYRCHLHGTGGIEESFFEQTIASLSTPRSDHGTEQVKLKEGRCVIL